MPIRRIALRLTIAIVGTVVVFALVTAGVEYEKTRPKPVTKYYGLNLGASADEALYVLGYPETVYEAVDKDGWQAITRTAELPKGKSIDDYREWAYDRHATRGRIEVNLTDSPKSVSRVSCYADEDQPGHCERVVGLTIGATEEQVKEHLGAPAREKYAGVSKQLDYPQWNLSLLFTKQRLYYIRVQDFAKLKD